MKRSQTPDVIANEVRLKRTQHPGSFLLLEGPDDSRLFRRFINAAHCKLVVAFNKQNVISAIELLDRSGFSGALGLVDSDFDVLNGTRLASPNTISGDCHDIEMMIARSPALEILLHELGSPEKIGNFERCFGGNVREWLISASLPLAYLRWHSQQSSIGLSFEDLRFTRFTNLRTLSIDRQALVREVRNHSQSWATSEEELLEAMSPPGRRDDPWHLCCGHDMIEFLTLALRRAIGSQQNLTAEHVSSSLRLAYTAHDFASSRLSDAIRSWEATSGFVVL